jgi:hypothetical protein
MHPLIIMLLAFFGVKTLFAGGSKRRRSAKGKFVSAGSRKRATGPKKASRSQSGGGRRFRMHNGKKQYLDGRGKPYTPKNAPDWLRKIWLEKARKNRK